MRLLCITAHPDDECFAFGGVLALAAQAGHETCVLCLTDGQAAKNRGASTSSEDLGKMRREEFAASCRMLGVGEFHLLDYQDGQLEHVDFAAAADRLVAFMRAWKPNVVVTFGADGGPNTHPDHTMVSLLASAAFHWAASAKRFPDAGAIHHADRMYVATTTYFLPDRPVPMPAPYSVALDIRSVLELKMAAFACHTSQAPLMEQTRGMFLEHGHTEYYLLTAVREPEAVELTHGVW